MNPDGQTYFGDEDEIPEADKKRYEAAFRDDFVKGNLFPTKEELLSDDYPGIDQDILDELAKKIKELEVRQRESEEQQGK